jgi:hypothetical protein
MGEVRQVFLAEQRVDPEIDVGEVAAPSGELYGRLLVFEPFAGVVAGMKGLRLAEAGGVERAAFDLD